MSVPPITEITDPLLIVYRAEDRIVTQIHPGPDENHESYGLLICDLVRHVANAFKVPETAVWKWVDLERKRPTSPIIQHS